MTITTPAPTAPTITVERAAELGAEAFRTGGPHAPGAHAEMRDSLIGVPVGAGAADLFTAYRDAYRDAEEVDAMRRVTALPIVGTLITVVAVEAAHPALPTGITGTVVETRIPERTWPLGRVYVRLDAETLNTRAVEVRDLFMKNHGGVIALSPSSVRPVPGQPAVPRSAAFMRSRPLAAAAAAALRIAANDGPIVAARLATNAALPPHPTPKRTGDIPAEARRNTRRAALRSTLHQDLVTFKGPSGLAAALDTWATASALPEYAPAR